MKKRLLSILILLIASNTWASTKSLTVTSSENNYLVDMGTIHYMGELFYELVIDVPNAKEVSIKGIQEFLAYCDLQDIRYYDGGASIILSFDVENDGGINSCEVNISTDIHRSPVMIELTAEVGE